MKKTNNASKVKWIGEVDKTAFIYYQGKDSSQFQATRYLGGKSMVASTGEVAAYAHKGINTLARDLLWTYPEIAEIEKKPVFGLLSRIKFWWRGVRLINTSNPKPYIPLYPFEEGSVFAYDIDNKQRSLGQLTDIEAHSKKYKALLEKHPEKTNKICYGVSRGAATTFAAIAANNYQDIKLCVLEAPPSSIRNLVKKIIPFGLGSWFYDSFLVKWIFGSQHNTAKSSQALAYVDKFPKNIPLVIISSIVDTTVSHHNSLELALRVAYQRNEDSAKGNDCAPVYFIQLAKGDHDDYCRSDSIPDAIRYQNVLHAIYKKHNLPHIAQFAALGEEHIDDTLLTEGVLAKQVNFEAQYREQKQLREQIRKNAISELYTAELSFRKQAICSEMRMYRDSSFSLFKPVTNTNTDKIMQSTLSSGIAS